MNAVFDHLVASYRLTCAACPTQYEGVLRNGRAFYFRYRHGSARLGFGATVGEAKDDRRATFLELGDGLDGFLDEEEFKEAFVRLATARWATA